MKVYLIMLVESMIVVLVAFSLWYRVFLPYSYLLGVAALAILIAYTILKERKLRPVFVVAQLFLVFLLMNNVYGLSTRYAVLPYGDAYWEYAVVKTFSQQETISVVNQTIYSTKLEWYSSWPFLHTLAVVFSQISGIDVFLTVLILPIFIGAGSFFILYALLERLRIALDLGHEVAYLGILIYVVSPDTLFWRTQFVRQDLGMFWLFFLFYVSYAALTVEQSSRKRKTALISLLLIPCLVVTHHLTSLIATLYLLLLFILMGIGMFIARKIPPKQISRSVYNSRFLLLTLGLSMLVGVFFYWDTIAQIIWPTIASRIDRLIQLLTGIREPNIYVPSAHYPSQLQPALGLWLLRARDVLIYIPAFFGALLLLKTRKGDEFTKLLILGSGLAFGLLFFSNDLTVRVEPFRLVAMSMPFIALLVGIGYAKLKKSRVLWNVFLPIVIITIIFVSFIGLWGHSFLPIQLYDPTVNLVNVGEHRDPWPMRQFLQDKITRARYDLIWTDDIASTILLLEPDQYERIRGISPKSAALLGSFGNEFFYEFGELGLYRYYAGIYSVIETPEESNIFSESLGENLTEYFNRVYDEGDFQIWRSRN